jgi:hypothetical protein
MTKADPNRYPKGWTAAKIRRLADFYDKQTDAQAIAEAEAAYRNRSDAWISVPVRLLPKVRRMIAKAS